MNIFTLWSYVFGSLVLIFIGSAITLTILGISIVNGITCIVALMVLSFGYIFNTIGKYQEAKQ